jgi:AraC-like DNA-binding protein
LSQAVDPFDKNSLTQQLLDDCLFILDNAHTRLDRGGLQRRTEERAIMKRVGEWAADSPEETVNLLELSKVAGVPLRQLQQAFKAYTGMTPSHWLRLRRLNSAHRELLNRRRNHRGRSGDELVVLASGAVFQQLSGAVQELPSETLKR